MANKHIAINIVLFATLMALTGISQAETILLPIAGQGDYLGEIIKPVKGQKQQQISHQFGTPIHTSTPTGTPPITRWDYPDFSVYFEGDVVIHSVLKHRRLDSQATNKR